LGRAIGRGRPSGGALANGHYTRELITPVGKLEQLRVPRDREGEFVTEVFERAVPDDGGCGGGGAQDDLQGVSVRRVAEITRALSRVKVGKDAVSRIARRRKELAFWRGRRLERAYPYLFLDATYLKVNCGERVREVALLVAVGVDEEGYREVPAVEAAGGERREAYRQLLRGLLSRGLRGVLPVVSDDHEAILLRWPASCRRRDGSVAWPTSSRACWPMCP